MLSLDHLAEGTGLLPTEVARILKLLTSRKKIENNEFIRLTCLPKSVARDFLRNLSPLLKPASQSIQLSNYGEQAIRNILEQATAGNLFKVFTAEDERKVTSIFERLNQLRPDADRNLDQFYATLDTVVARVRTMLNSGHLQNQRILFLGDDDLTSVAVAYLKVCSRITVVDLDIRILEIIEFINSAEGFAIEAVWQDLRDNLEQYLQGSFDLCFTDPPYTPSGIKLFVSRAVQGLATDNSKHLYLCYGHSMRNPEKAIEIQRIISDSGLVIESKLPDFNKYRGAESIGSCSSLYVCSTTKMSKVLRVGQSTEEIYTGQEVRTTPKPAEPSPISLYHVSKELAQAMLETVRIKSDDVVLAIGSSLDILVRRLAESARQVLVIDLANPIVGSLDAPEGATSNVLFVKWDALQSNIAKCTKIIAYLPLGLLKKLIETLKGLPFEMALIVSPQLDQAMIFQRDAGRIDRIALLLKCYFVTEIVESLPETVLLGRAAKLHGLILEPVAKSSLLQTPVLYICREIFEQRDKILKNALREALIRYSEAMGNDMTKRDARSIMDDVIADKVDLNSSIDTLNREELGALYNNLQLWSQSI